ncbi:Fic family protein [Pedobacter sp. CCM 8938]|uniref:Fic family protein n=1 Tax=Pedobacter fastidiosus TaxID=2765361 RepID=A0ABR7KP29_9SPHI|nr:Fic family protein [Pedobacter fastidiosus]MBC6109704.1 Fic family protein [Pedobacter fastidiosus]
MKTENKNEIISILESRGTLSSNEIFQALTDSQSLATVKRILSNLEADGIILSKGKARATKYELSPSFQLLKEIDLREYFKKEQDEREIKNNFNFNLITEVLSESQLFTVKEQESLEELHDFFKEKISKLSKTEYNKEMERLAIDLSWKSSQIEGNTYSLLETELLLKEKETAPGKPKQDAIMLLNHKEALNFIIEHSDYIVPITIRGIEDIHSLLIKDLDVDRNIRRGRVGITGTNYTPLDNEYQIREALREMCSVINAKKNVLEKALLTLVLLSYIQAFADGNKRTARIVSNGVLFASGYCPISFRTIDSITYKEAMLVFYELNNISVFKRIFIEQYTFAVKNYF